MSFFKHPSFVLHPYSADPLAIRNHSDMNHSTAAMERKTPDVEYKVRSLLFYAMYISNGGAKYKQTSYVLVLACSLTKVLKEMTILQEEAGKVVRPLS